MATYNTQYYMAFTDRQQNDWRIDFRLKDGPVVLSPRLINGSGIPLRIEHRNNDESKFTPIIQATCTIEYQYQQVGDPLPEEFIDIDNDTWLIAIYKNGNIDWNGFINPDNNTYSWVAPPFTFSIIATDFSFTESQPINLDQDGMFLYAHISIGDFINRTLFATVGYDDPVVNIIYTKKPNIIGSELITDSLFVHTDAFYEFDTGPLTAYDSLSKFLSSWGARMFYANGAYWIEYISDIGDVLAPILQITPSDLAGQEIDMLSPFVSMGNTVGDAVVYYNQSQEITVNKSLRKKKFTYNLKAINQLVNFKWDNFTPPNILTGWSVGSDMNIDRVGLGSVTDPFRLRIFDRSGSGTFTSVQQGITAVSGQRLQLQVKIIGNYAKDIGIGIGIGQSANTQFYMDSAGNWVAPNTGSTSNIVFPVVIPDTNIANVDILSNPIPADATQTDIHLYISYPRPVDSGVPPGETLWADIYPVFLNRFNDLYVSYDEIVMNDSRFSYEAEGEELFFMDKGDDNLSNTIFYDDGGIKKALPVRNWDGESLDEFVTKQQAIQQSDRTITVMGDFLGNTATFEQAVLLRDKGNLPTIFIRDSQDVRNGIRSMAVSQTLRTTETNIQWTLIPRTKESQ